MEFIKSNSFQTSFKKFYFWRSNDGVEIDLIIDNGTELIPVEIKSGFTYHDMWWRNIIRWKKFSKISGKSAIIYPGENNMTFSDGRMLVDYKNLQDL